MKEVKWSDEQLEVINSNQKRILVSASAGSGKTSVMIQRILRLITDGVRLSDMLICTFTKASAADMRSKLYKEITENMNMCSGVVKSRLDSALKELSRADISTIDSFCQRLIGKYFYLIGVDPQFDVPEEGQSKILRTNCARRAAEESDNADFKELCMFLSGRKNDAVLNAILEIMNYKSLDPSASLKYEYDEEEIKLRLSEYKDTQRSALKKKIDKAFNYITDNRALDALVSSLDSLDRFPALNKENKMYSGLYGYLKDKVKEFDKLKEKIAGSKPQSLSEKYITALFEVAEEAIRLYGEEKQKRSLVDFADLENMAYKILLKQNEELPVYKYVFVDEYQDINPLQERIISLVAGENNLFMVGDLKQSIYAFRGCEPKIFKDKYDEYKNSDNGQLINLDLNFRSSKQIIDFVNEVFCTLMTEEFGSVDYKANPMKHIVPGNGYVRFNVVNGRSTRPLASGVYSVKDSGITRRMSAPEAEAILMANRIKELLEHGFDGKEVLPRDIAVITRTMGTSAKFALEKLRALEIPVSLKENAYFLNRPETGQLINLLRLIDNMRDDKAMAIAMLSPFGGFTEEELAAIKDGDCFYESVQKAAKVEGKVKAFIDKIEGYYNKSLVLNADELADLIVSEEGYFNYAFSLKADAAEVLDRFLEYLNNCPKKSSLNACLKFIDEHDPYTELTGDEDSVKLMTAHKSKGLQFKFVFLIGLSDIFNTRDFSKHIVIGHPAAMDVFEDHEAKLSDLKLLYTIAERKKQLEQELRILYVAMTRAETGLELFGSLDDELLSTYRSLPDKSIMETSEYNSFAKWLIFMMDGAQITDIDDIFEDSEVDLSEPLDADVKLAEKLKNYFDFSPPAKAPYKSYVTRIAHSDDDEEELPVMFSEDESSIERGNAYHRALEKIDFIKPDISVVDPEDLKLIDVDKIYSAAKKMNGFGGKVYKEKPFIIKLGADELNIAGSGDVLVQGVIDLLIIDGAEAVIVDYKTGAPHGRFEKGYFKQLNLYAEAVNRLLNKTVTKKYLYYIDAEIFVEAE